MALGVMSYRGFEGHEAWKLAAHLKHVFTLHLLEIGCYESNKQTDINS